MESHDLEDQLIERAPTLAGPVQVLSSEQRSGRTVHSVSASRLVPVDDKDPVLRDISIAVPVTAEVEVDGRGRVTRVSADDVDPAAAREARAFKTTNDEELYRLLAARMKVIDRDPTTAGIVEPSVQDAARGIAPADLLKFGKQAFANISVAGQAVVCGSADQGYHLQKLLASF